MSQAALAAEVLGGGEVCLLAGLSAVCAAQFETFKRAAVNKLASGYLHVLLHTHMHAHARTWLP